MSSEKFKRIEKCLSEFGYKIRKPGNSKSYQIYKENKEIHTESSIHHGTIESCDGFYEGMIYYRENFKGE